MCEESPYPREPFRDAPSSEAQRALYDSYDRLVEILADLGNDDARGRLRGALWSLDGAPEIGFAFAEVAAERMRGGQYMLAPDLVQDALRNVQLTEQCWRQSRFARESILRYLHAAGDLLSQVVNAALGVGMAEGNCDLRKVTEHPQVQATTALASALMDLQASEVYRYAADATNRMKHRNFLPGGIKASLDEERTAINVSHLTGAFAHGQRKHPEASLDELRPEVDTLRSLAARIFDEIAHALPDGRAARTH